MTPPRAFRSRPDSATAGFAGSDSRQTIIGLPLAVTKKSHPFVVEIGCGVGLHPILYATEFPKKTVLAIERTTAKFEKFAGRLEHHPGLQSRICAVHADAIHFLDREITDDSIDEVWILYPNPEIKKPSRRWFQTPFMSRLIELMRHDATLYFATNISDYAEEAIRLAPQHGLHLTRSERVLRTTHPKWKSRTHFEKKYLDRGQTIINLEFLLKKSGDAT